MSTKAPTDGRDFELQVLRVARGLWMAENAGSQIVDSRERDFVLETEELYHIIECTTSRTKEKAVNDADKLIDLQKKYSRTKTVKCWFITKDEPTGDQRSAIEDLVKKKGAQRISVLSYEQFQAKLIPIDEYLQLREQYDFGSVQSPSESVKSNTLRYIPAGLSCSTNEVSSVADVCDSLARGSRLFVSGDYGIGKSMLLREVFRSFRLARESSKTPWFTAHINLRDHSGQDHPHEILERHARAIGFSDPARLVRAWRTGYVHLLLDGFDEIGSISVATNWRYLKDVRRRSLTGVRKLIAETPQTAGVILAGRDNYFSTLAELESALGIDSCWHRISLHDFDETELLELVSSLGFRGKLPYWLPGRPLLVATLCLKAGALFDLKEYLSSAASGWDLLLDEISKREARIEFGVGSAELRMILERFSTFARQSEDGMSGITRTIASEVFSNVCGYDPTGEALSVVLRLPGLSADSNTEDSRRFIDQDFTDACRSGDVLRIIENPFDSGLVAMFKQARHILGEIGVGILRRRMEGIEKREGILSATFEHLGRNERVDVLKHDLVQTCAALPCEVKTNVNVSDIEIEDLILDSSVNMSNVTYVGCLFGSIELGSMSDGHIPYFDNCLIDQIIDRTSQSDIPMDRFENSEVVRYGQDLLFLAGKAETSIPSGRKVLLVVLRKLFMQGTSGRSLTALCRGIEPKKQYCVKLVIDRLIKEGMVLLSTRPGEEFYEPVLRKRKRAMIILTTPNAAVDKLVQDCDKI